VMRFNENHVDKLLYSRIHVSQQNNKIRQEWTLLIDLECREYGVRLCCLARIRLVRGDWKCDNSEKQKKGV